MKLALCQLEIIWEDKKKTFDLCSRFMEEAAQRGADLILFPEMSLTGFSMDIEKTKESKQETAALFAEHARLCHIAAGFGFVSAREDKAQNHYMIVDDRGKLLADYCKIHPFSYGGEDRYFVAGEKLALCRYKDFTIGISICYDLRFPELYQLLSRQAELIVVPANWPEARREHWNCLLQARAIENQSYIAGINCVGKMGGKAYSGDSGVIHPLGTICGKCGEQQELLIVEIDNDVHTYRESFPVKKDRKEALYQKLGEC